MHDEADVGHVREPVDEEERDQDRRIAIRSDTIGIAYPQTSASTIGAPRPPKIVSTSTLGPLELAADCSCSPPVTPTVSGARAAAFTAAGMRSITPLPIGRWGLGRLISATSYARRPKSAWGCGPAGVGDVEVPCAIGGRERPGRRHASGGAAHAQHRRQAQHNRRRLLVA